MKPLHLAMILAIDVVWGCNIVAVKEGVMSAGPVLCPERCSCRWGR